MSEERVTGTVTTELKTEGSGGDTQGRISYENRGECFFLPYTKDDVEGNVTLRAGDKVSFQIATNNRYVNNNKLYCTSRNFVTKNTKFWIKLTKM